MSWGADPGHDAGGVALVVGDRQVVAALRADDPVVAVVVGLVADDAQVVRVVVRVEPVACVVVVLVVRESMSNASHVYVPK
jgi:hypothetical protein